MTDRSFIFQENQILRAQDKSLTAENQRLGDLVKYQADMIREMKGKKHGRG